MKVTGYNTFPPIKLDRGAAISQFKAAGKWLHLLGPEESHEF